MSDYMGQALAMDWGGFYDVLNDILEVTKSWPVKLRLNYYPVAGEPHWSAMASSSRDHGVHVCNPEDKCCYEWNAKTPLRAMQGLLGELKDVP